MSAYHYNYNLANQRTKATQPDGSYWEYGYDAQGQLINGKKHSANSAPIPGYAYGYHFDNIGNRTQTNTNGNISKNSTGNQVWSPSTQNPFKFSNEYHDQEHEDLTQYLMVGVRQYKDIMAELLSQLTKNNIL